MAGTEGRFKDIWCGRKTAYYNIKSFYEKASACVKISGETSEHFEIKVGLKQGCVMSPWLFNIFMDGCMREMKCKVVLGYVMGVTRMPNKRPHVQEVKQGMTVP